MTALTAARITDRYGATPIPELLRIAMKANAKVYQGGLVVVDATGYGVAALTGPGLVVVGKARATVDNAGGASGAKNIEVERGAFLFTNSAGNDAITQADFGRTVFLVDDQTVARTDASGTRSIAGKMIGIEAGQIIVEVGTLAGAQLNGAIDIQVVTAADLSTHQFKFVALNAAGALVLAGVGAGAIGILQNAPVNGAIGVVRCLGKSLVISGGAYAAGDRLASDAASKAKTAVAASTNTSDAGAAQDALVGSHVMGFALEAAAGADLQKNVMVLPMGAVPTTAA